MPKYFFIKDVDVQNEITINGPAAHHLLHVLRIKKGDGVVLCDGNNNDYHCTFLFSKNRNAYFKVNHVKPCETELPFNITLYQCLPKDAKLEFIIQKSVELGVHNVVPVQSNRSAVKRNDTLAKQERYRRIAESAAGQSMRGIIPLVSPVRQFHEIISNPQKQSVWIVLYENEKIATIKKILAPLPVADIGIWVGPEGGFTDEEIHALRISGGITATLGRRTLRTETAGIAAIAQVSCCREES
jgi:16S rRNA (uracil1498-N3)-methyltransferase